MKDTTENSNEAREELSFQHPMYVLFRHKKKVVLCFVVLMALVTFAALSQRSTFRSEAKLLVQIGRESVSLDPTASTGQTVDLRQDRDRELRAELAILQSPDLSRLVVRSMGAPAILDPGHAEGDTEAPGGSMGPVRRLRKFVRGLLPSSATGELSAEDQAFFVVHDGLDIELVDDSSVLALSFEGPHPHLAQGLLDNLIERFQERHLEVHRTPGSYEFFAEQSAHFAGELERAEEELRRVKGEAGFASIKDLRSALLERLARMSSDLDQTEANIGSSQATSVALRGILEGLDPTVVISHREADSNPTADYLRQRIGELKLEEKGLALNFNEDSLRLRGVREQVRAAEELLQATSGSTSEVTRGPNETRLKIEIALLQDEARLESLSGRRDVLLARQSELEGKLEALNGRELQVTRLQRTIGGLERNYLRYAESLEQARVGQALEIGKISNIRVIQPATLPLKPNSRGRGFTLALGALFSLLGALSLAFVAERLDSSIKTPEDARRHLGLATVAAIPKRSLYRSKTAAKASAEGVARNGHASPNEFVELGDLVLALNRSTEPRCIVLGLTSARRGEGVSTVSAHLAATLAQQADGPVLLVDAELESPRAHGEFHLDLAPGLSEYLDVAGEIPIQEAPISNLHVLSAGRGGHPQELLKNGRFEALLNHWRRDFSFVVVDLPALSEPSSATRLAALCDAVLLVVAAETHPWQVADHGLGLLQRCKAKVLGAVLNKRRYPSNV